MVRSIKKIWYKTKKQTLIKISKSAAVRALILDLCKSRLKFSNRSQSILNMMPECLVRKCLRYGIVSHNKQRIKLN